MSTAADTTGALFFDGHSGRGVPVLLHVDGGTLVATATASTGDTDQSATGPATWRWPLAQVEWPERTRHAQRQVALPGRASLLCADSAAFDAWRQRAGHRDSWVVRAQQNWRATAAAALAVAVLMVGGWVWGVPAAARMVLLLVPTSADEAVGAQALDSIEGRWLQPSALPAARQQALQQAFAQLAPQAYPGDSAPRYTLRFAAATKALGPNAFALPGGQIVVTDALVTLLDGHDDTLLGVMAHELGHVQHRHGMRALVQFTLLSAAAGAVLGDFSSMLAAAPALMLQLGYSRDAEREADAVAARALQASGRSPAAMVVLFDKIAALPQRLDVPIALASHPADAERVRFFKTYGTGSAAAQR